MRRAAPRSVLCLAALLAGAYLAGCGGSGDSAPSATQGTGSPRTGTVSPRSAPFRQYSARGKLHLAEFGTEASGGEREAAQTVLEAYRRQVQARKWAGACVYVSASTKAQAREFAAHVDPAKAQGCGGALKLVFDAQSADANIHSLVRIASLRAKDGAGFALLHGAGGADYWMAIKIEGGEWKVLSAVPQAFG